MSSELGDADAPGREGSRLRVGRWRRRAFDGVTRSRLALLLLFCLTWAFSRVLHEVVLAWNAGEILDWLIWEVGGEFGCILLIALLGAAPLVVAFNLGPRRGLARVGVLSAAVVLAGALGGLVRYGYILEFSDLDVSKNLLPNATLWFARYAELATLLVIVIEFGRRESQSLDALHEAEIDRLALDREMAEARLQVLQAQIEPHFLFNTLANVRRLYVTEPAAGGEMLGNLMRYLEVALPQMRAGDSTLGRELALVEAYLQLQRVRMGSRLAYRVDVPDPLRGAALPPMMLITLVENAIKHGLNALPEGGAVRIAAAVDEAGRLRIEVADDGAGFQAAAGGGTGLANIRARLGALYGEAARLDLGDNRPRGVVSTLYLPCLAA
jgi:signal transduction histidine kinase